MNSVNPSERTPEKSLPGTVWAHVGQAFQPRPYDVIIIGAGRMGSLTAHYLRKLAPHLTLLLLEENGLPNEEGATILAPGIWTARHLPMPNHNPGQATAQGEATAETAALVKAQAWWSRKELQTAFGNIQFQERTLLDFHAEPGPARQRTNTLPWFTGTSSDPDLRELVNLDALPYATVEDLAATYQPGLLALHAAQQAIQAGADFMLNARATLNPTPLLPHKNPHSSAHGNVTVERLTVTNTHQVITHETHHISAKHVIVAMGAHGPQHAEQHLGRHTTHGHAYRQTVRLNTPTNDETPILRTAGLTLRPQNGAYHIIPAIHHRDPHGYQPTGAKLTSVPTGLRRETLEDLVQLMHALPILSSSALEIGHTLSDLPGAWIALPGGQPHTPPQHQALTPPDAHPTHHLILGGPQADTLAPATAYDLAAQVAGITPRPWQ